MIFVSELWLRGVPSRHVLVKQRERMLELRGGPLHRRLDAEPLREVWHGPVQPFDGGHGLPPLPPRPLLPIAGDVHFHRLVRARPIIQIAALAITSILLPVNTGSSAGYYSTTGMNQCAPCAIGKYQVTSLSLI